MTAPNRIEIQGDGLQAAEAARKQILELCEKNHLTLVVDCGRLQIANTCLLQVLVAAEAFLALRGRTMRIAGMDQQFRSTLEIAGMKGWFLEARDE